MKEHGWKKTGWESSDLAEAHRTKSISILLNNDEDLFHRLFHYGPPLRLRNESDIYEQGFKLLKSGDAILIRAALDFYNSTGDLPLWECLWGLDYLVLIRLIRAICHLREIQLEGIQGIMNDYLGPVS
jgi:hypothetical protein